MELYITPQQSRDSITQADFTEAAIVINGVSQRVNVTSITAVNLTTATSTIDGVTFGSNDGTGLTRVTINYNRLEITRTPQQSRNLMIHASLVFRGTRINSLNNFATNAQGRLIYTQTPVPVQPISVTLDGRPMTFDVPPQSIGGRTMVPMRAIFDALGAEVGWNSTTQTITATKDTTVIVLRIGNPAATVNGSSVTLEQPATIIDGRTLVPLRFVGDALGAEVGWDGASRTVTITT